MLVGGAGYQVQGIAVAWHVYELHRSPFDLGLVGLALFLPAFLFVVPAGALADARDRVRVALVALGCEAAGIVAFLAFAASGSRSLPGYLAILFTIGTARAFGTPAERSIGPSLVATADYMRVQATYTSLRQVVQIGGPAVGGVLVAFGLPLALGVALALMAAQAVAFLGIGPIGGGSQVARASLGTALDGIRFIARSPIVAGAITLDLFAVLFGGATALLPAFADGIFHVGAPGLGLLRGADGVGAALVAALVARRPVRRRIGATLLGAVAVFGFATIAFGLSRNFALSLVLLAVVGGADVVSVVIRSSLVQLGTPAEMRGRVNAVESVFIGASNELGEFESGTLAALVGVVPAVVLGGVATLGVIAVAARAFPALRRADAFEEAAESG